MSLFLALFGPRLRAVQCPFFPDFQPGLRIAAASNAMAGRPEQARKAVARLRQLNPKLRVSTLKNVRGPYRRAEDLSLYEEGLRQAGLPE
jgi:hypothetical protein